MSLIDLPIYIIARGPHVSKKKKKKSLPNTKSQKVTNFDFWGLAILE
jgi:hypothetical protein